MAKIGILGGMGPQASNKLYELLIAGTSKYTAAAVDEDYPEIVLFNVPVPNFISDKTNLTEAKRMLVERTKLLEQAGCTINGIACNTAHILLPDLQVATSVPFLSIPKLVAEQVQRLGFKKVGLLGTPTTLNSRLYDDALQDVAEVMRPTVELCQATEAIIYKQLSASATDAEKKVFGVQVALFKQELNLDGILLGCTELPLVLDSSRDNSLVDTLQVLADGLLQAYFDVPQIS